MTDLLRRQLAPIVDSAWKEIDLHCSRVLKGNLSGRRLVDFVGPLGLHHAAVNLGRLEVGKDGAPEGVAWGLHKVLPLVEVRVPFTLDIWELDNLERGAKDPALAALGAAARKAAAFEETVIYHGFSGAGMEGLLAAATHPPVPLHSDPDRLTESVEQALLAIQEAEIGGPFALVLGTESYKRLMVGDPKAYPLRARIEALVKGGIHWSPVLEGGAVLSRRGGDFELTVGQDLTIGYKFHDSKEVQLYLTESFAFRVIEPAAAVELKAIDVAP